MNFSSNILSISNYVQDNDTYTAEGTNDLMWFPWDGSSYTKRTAEIIANMKHACSWITIQVKGEGITVSPTPWQITDITINGLVSKGNVDCKYTKSGENYIASTDWTLSTQSSDIKTYNIFTGTQNIATGVAKCETEGKTNNTIVIPQKPTSIDVTYTYVSQEGATDAQDIKVTETKNVSLKLNDDNTINWESGKHYIYTITFTATEILVDPYVSTWTEYSPAPTVPVN